MLCVTTIAFVLCVCDKRTFRCFNSTFYFAMCECRISFQPAHAHSQQHTMYSMLCTESFEILLKCLFVSRLFPWLSLSSLSLESACATLHLRFRHFLLSRSTACFESTFCSLIFALRIYSLFHFLRQLPLHLNKSYPKWRVQRPVMSVFGTHTHTLVGSVK